MEITCSRDKGCFSFYQITALRAPEGEPRTSKAESHCTLNAASPGFQTLSFQAQKSKPATSSVVHGFPHYVNNYTIQPNYHSNSKLRIKSPHLAITSKHRWEVIGCISN